MLERYYYVVTPKNGPDRIGQPAESNHVLAGTAYQPPYADDFSDASTQTLWTVVNANDDRGSWGTEFTWQFSSWSGYWNISTSSYNMGDDEQGMDDWIISPGISLETGSAYALTVRMANSFAHYTERVALLMGTDPTDLQTFRVMDSNEAYDVEGKPTDWEVDFTVEEPDTYYFAVRCYTGRDDQGSSLSLLRLAVDRLGATEAPAEATALSITPEPTGLLQADVCFTAPTTTLGGNALSGALQADIYRDAEHVATVSTEAGQLTTWTDEAVPTVGMHTYAVALSNAAGAGKRTEAEAFIGVFTAPYYNTFDVADDARFFNTVNDSAFYSSNEYRWIWDNYSQHLALGGYGYLVQHPEERIWLFMPAIKLEADQVYTYSFDWANSSYYESCLGYAGIGMAPDSTAQTLFPCQLPFTGYSDMVTVDNEVITTETGKYYPSILVIDNRLYDYASPKIDNVSIVHVGSARAPFAVADLTLTPDAQGRLEAVLSCTAPATDYAQRPLEEPLTVSIYREGSPIPVATLTDVQPGQQLQWTDTQPLNGRNAYTVVAQNSYGRGKAATVEGFVGIDVPMAVQNLRIRGNEDNQKAIISWDAPADKGVNGGVIDGSLTYSVLEYFPDETDPDLQLNLLTTTTQTTLTIDREPTDEMEQHHYFVVPQTSGGVGAAAYDFVVLGRLKAMPFAESFADGYLSASGWVELSDGAQYGTKWYIIPDDDEKQLYAQDSDNGLAFCYNGNYMDAPHWDELITPKMKIDGGGKYIVSFYVYTGMPLYTNAEAPRLEVELSQDDSDFVALCEPIDITQGETGWTLFQLPFVAEPQAHHMKLCFRGTMNNMSENLLLDNITVVTDDGTVGIMTMYNEQCTMNNEAYDLQGRRVDSSVFNSESPIKQRGIYIVGGQKTIRR